MVYFGGHKKRHIYRFFCALISIFVLLLTPFSTSALSHFDHIVFKENNILFYNPDEKCDNLSVAIYGDSLSVQMQDAGKFSEAFPNAAVDAIWGRPWVSNTAKYDELPSGLDSLKQNGVSSDAIIWLLGQNNRAHQSSNWFSDLTEADITALRETAGESTPIFVMTGFDDANHSVFDNNNALIRAAVEQYDNWFLLDWATLGASNPNYTVTLPDDYNDDVYGTFKMHLSDEGMDAFIEMIKTALEESKDALCSSRRRNKANSCTNPIASDLGDNAKTIFSFLVASGYSPTAAAAIMGNLFAESGLNPRQLEHQYNDSKYPPNGVAPENFVAYQNGNKTYEGGFGIAQWTSAGRVQNLQNYANSQNKSVTSITIQVEFLVKELTGSYGLTPSVLNSLSLRDATALVLKKYESPKNQSEAVVDTRTNNASKYTGLSPSDNLNCPKTDTTIKDIKSGGLNDSEAKALMEAYRAINPRFVSQNPDLVKFGINSAPSCTSDLENCVAFVKWFMYNYTTTPPSSIGNGGQVVSNLISNYGWTDGGNTPQPYAVFSTSSGQTVCSDGKLCGHTGVILGINSQAGTALIGEAGCSQPFSWTGVHSKSLSELSNYTFAYPPGLKNVSEGVNV